jgi:hypothetical protein
VETYQAIKNHRGAVAALEALRGLLAGGLFPGAAAPVLVQTRAFVEAMHTQAAASLAEAEASVGPQSTDG